MLNANQHEQPSTVARLGESRARVYVHMNESQVTVSRECACAYKQQYEGSRMQDAVGMERVLISRADQVQCS
jgi:hypothetical protein